MFVHLKLDEAGLVEIETDSMLLTCRDRDQIPCKKSYKNLAGNFTSHQFFNSP
jgi:hypothetical protein